MANSGTGSSATTGTQICPLASGSLSNSGQSGCAGGAGQVCKRHLHGHCEPVTVIVADSIGESGLGPSPRVVGPFSISLASIPKHARIVGIDFLCVGAADYSTFAVVSGDAGVGGTPELPGPGPFPVPLLANGLKMVNQNVQGTYVFTITLGFRKDPPDPSAEGDLDVEKCRVTYCPPVNS